MIELALREKRFAGASRPTLENTRLRLKDGEFAALLGPSGAGKTTLLRILAGLDADFAGEVRPRPEKRELRVAYLFQEPRLMPWLTVAENVALVVRDDSADVPGALKSVGMLDAAALYPRQLSGGMQRRVALARAIVHRPRLLLLDEPFVSLDQPSVLELHELLRAYWEREAPTVLMVSHSLDESIALAQRLLFLGGAPATLIHEYSVQLPATRTVADEAVRRLRERLLEAQPALLSGRLSP